MRAQGLEGFRRVILTLLRRDIFEPNYKTLPPVLARQEDDTFVSDLTRDQRLLADIFWGAAEIWESLDVLADIETYLSRAPRKELGIPKSRHLAYHIGNYLQETYLLRERVNVYCDTLKKKYRKSPAHDPQGIEAARSRLNAALKGLVEVRGTHVHQQRFTDPELHELAGLEILLHGELEERLRRFAIERSQRIYRQMRDRWRDRIKENNALKKMALDSFFDSLQAFLFDDRGEVRRPNNWPSS